MNPEFHPVYDQEIDLRQLIATLWRRRRPIAVIIVVCVVIAGAYSFLGPQVFESQAMIQVSAQSAPAYASPAAAAQLIGSLTFLSRVAQATAVADSPRVLQTRVHAQAIRDTPFVRLSVRARNPEEAHSLARAVANAFLAAASAQVLERRQATERRLAAVNEQLDEIRRVLSMSRQTLVQLQERHPFTSEQEGFVRLFTLNAIGVSESLHSSLMVVQKDLTLEVLELQPPRLVEEPTQPDVPSAPKAALNISLAFIFGVVAAVLGVIVFEVSRSDVKKTPSSRV